MSHHPAFARIRGIPHPTRHDLSHSLYQLAAGFATGPKQLLTSRISGKCAAMMIALCLPSLLFCAVMTIPGLLFQSPQQNAYFYFSRMLEADPGRWAVMLLTGISALVSLTLPANLTGATPHDHS